MKSRDEFIVMIVIACLLLIGVGSCEAIKAKSSIEMCRIYYPEISAWDCYWSSTTLPARKAQR